MYIHSYIKYANGEIQLSMSVVLENLPLVETSPGTGFEERFWEPELEEDNPLLGSTASI